MNSVLTTDRGAPINIPPLKYCCAMFVILHLPRILFSSVAIVKCHKKSCVGNTAEERSSLHLGEKFSSPNIDLGATSSFFSVQPSGCNSWLSFNMFFQFWMEEVFFLAHACPKHGGK